MTLINIKNIEDFRGDLKIQTGDLPFDIWDIFDYSKFKSIANTQIVSLDKINSTKNELLDEKFLAGEKNDPRENAFEFMKKAASNKIDKRAPIEVTSNFHIIDGNATAQVLMLAGWKEVAVEIIN